MRFPSELGPVCWLRNVARWERPRMIRISGRICASRSHLITQTRPDLFTMARSLRRSSTCLPNRTTTSSKRWTWSRFWVWNLSQCRQRFLRTISTISEITTYIDPYHRQPITRSLSPSKLGLVVRVRVSKKKMKKRWLEDWVIEGRGILSEKITLRMRFALQIVDSSYIKANIYSWDNQANKHTVPKGLPFKWRLRFKCLKWETLSIFFL